ncbi:MAG: allantoate amidohydrolase [Spirochaetaceae bacterium]|nr:MAG: allantoate amidohydrolase [Spirochaetaceae bacterium]
MADRILAQADRLASCSEGPRDITRTFLTPAMADAHGLLSQWMRDAGMTVRCDVIGNLVGTLPADASCAAGQTPRRLLLGSHIDTVRQAGRYDGVLGVLVAIAAAAQIARTARRVSVDVIAFCEEEGVRYRAPFLGSRAIAGSFDLALLSRADDGGVTMAEAIRSFGGDPDRIDDCSYRGETLIGYVEVHIEQGPILELASEPVGLVTSIAGQRRASIRFAGAAGHAGTVPMAVRRDALVAAAEFVLATEELARETTGMVATVGTIEVAPGASNVIPGEARCSLDLRHQHDEIRDRGFAGLRETAERIAGERSLGVTWTDTDRADAVPMDAELTAMIDAAAGGGLPRLASGAGHDAMVMASLCPTSMLFVRCAGGISHNPAEAVLAGDVARALEVVVSMLHRVEEEASIG